MTKTRKSFLLHIDSLDILDELTSEEAGDLFKAIKDYQNDVDSNLHGLVRIAFSPFKNQFVRDVEKYNLTCERRALAGSMGGLAKVANASKSKQKVANVADSVSKNKNDSKSDSDSKNNNDLNNTSVSRFSEFWVLYGKKVDTKKCEAKFNKLTKTEVEALFSKLPDYIKSTPDKQYRKNPVTWLNGKCWNDEIQFQLSGNQSNKHDLSSQDYSKYEGAL
jgi:hypothetical protein